MAFRGVEVGELEALLKTASPQYKSRPYSSALEDSAVAGKISPERAALYCIRIAQQCEYPGHSALQARDRPQIRT